MAAEEITLQIKTLADQSYSLTVPTDLPVPVSSYELFYRGLRLTLIFWVGQAFKSRVHALTQVESDRQRLIYRGKVENAFFFVHNSRPLRHPPRLNNLYNANPCPTLGRS